MDMVLMIMLLFVILLAMLVQMLMLIFFFVLVGAAFFYFLTQMHVGEGGLGLDFVQIYGLNKCYNFSITCPSYR